MKEEHDKAHVNWGRRDSDFVVDDIKGHGFLHNIGIRMLILCMAIFVIITLMFGYQQYMFPVISDFSVSTLTSKNGTVEIYGTFNKERGCRFTNITAYAIQDGEEYADLVELTFGDSGDKHRAPIKQKYGPWWISVPADFSRLSIEIYSTHNCNMIYRTTTKIASFNLRKTEDGLILLAN